MYEELRLLVKDNLEKLKLPLVAKTIDDSIIAWVKSNYRVFDEDELE